MIQLYDVINCTVFILLVYFFFSHFCDRRIKTRAHCGLIIALWVIVALFVSNLLAANFALKIVIVIIMNLIFASILFSGSISVRLSLVLLSYNISLVLDFFTYTVGSMFFERIEVQDLNQSVVFVIYGCISQFLLFIIIFALCHFASKSNLKNSTNLLIKYSVVPTISLAINVSFVQFFQGVSNVYENGFFITLALFLIVLNVYTIIVFISEAKRTANMVRQELNQEYTKELVSLYNNIREENNMLSHLEHEYKNKLTYIFELSSQGNTRAILSFIDKENDASPTTHNIICTGNAVTDAIINLKYREAVSKRILLKLTIGDLSNLTLSENDLVVLWFNLLNNAIEACEKQSNTTRSIHLVANLTEDLLCVHVKNTYDGVLNVKNDKFLSTKQTGKHGYGLDNISEIVNKYNGTMNVNAAESKFEVSLVIWQQ